MTTYNFEMFTGNDRFIQVSLKDSNGDPVDITGYTISFVVKLTKAGSALITKTTPTEVVITDATNGVFVVNLADTDSDALTEASHWYEIKVTTDTNVEVTVVDGKIRFKKSLFSS